MISWWKDNIFSLIIGLVGVFYGAHLWLEVAKKILSTSFFLGIFLFFGGFVLMFIGSLRRN